MPLGVLTRAYGRLAAKLHDPAEPDPSVDSYVDEHTRNTRMAACVEGEEPHFEGVIRVRALTQTHRSTQQRFHEDWTILELLVPKQRPGRWRLRNDSR